MDPEGSKKTPVLLAEDNQVNRKMMTLLLNHLGVNPDIASNGLEAVEMALEGGYDLVIMDMHMPRMDGLEATAKIKKEMGDKAPVVIALTADIIQSSMDQAIRAGVDAYLAKPISKENLKEYLDKYCFNK